MNVLLTPGFKQLVARKVGTGMYQTANEVIREALRLLKQRNLRLESLRRHVRTGFDAVDRGEFSDYDASNITELADRGKARGRKRLAIPQLSIVKNKGSGIGSCSPGSASIRLNTDLAKKPRECLEYIVVHEMAHLLEPTHNSRFIALMDLFMPNWRFYREGLNRLPVRHEIWRY